MIHILNQNRARLFVSTRHYTNHRYIIKSVMGQSMSSTPEPSGGNGEKFEVRL